MTSKSIKNKISNFETGKVFRLEDLGLPRSEQNAAVVTLGRLVQEGEIERLSRGTYYKPKRTRFGVVGPSMEERLDCLKWIKKIPDTTTDRSYTLLKAKVNEYSKDELTQLVNLALKYSPLTRALLGSMLTNDSLATTLFQTLSPLTRFRVGLSPTLVSSQWNIQ